MGLSTSALLPPGCVPGIKVDTRLIWKGVANPVTSWYCRLENVGARLEANPKSIVCIFNPARKLCGAVFGQKFPMLDENGVPGQLDLPNRESDGQEEAAILSLAMNSRFHSRLGIR